ncbi:hypothetical protein Tco_0497303 [Tanacetum coccineum]
MCSMIVKNIKEIGWPMRGGGGDGEFLEEGGEECGFDSKEDEVIPKVEDVSLVDGVFDGALGGDGNEDFAIGEGGLDDEAWVEAIEEQEEEEKEDKDDEENGEDDYLIMMRWINVVRHGNREFGFQSMFSKMQKDSQG